MHAKIESASQEQDRKSRPPRRERLLNDLELAALERALTQHEKEQPSSSYSVNAIRFLLYTGCRISELLNLRWADVHLEEGYLDLQDARTGPKIIPLMDRAKRIMIPLQQQEGNSYVFCGNLSGNPLANIKRTWHKVCALAGIPDVRVHDLRYSFASFALKKGVDLYTVSELIGHKDKEMPVRLAPIKLEHLKEATNKVAGVFS
jgi:integrase